jgi:hypothetical protein
LTGIVVDLSDNQLTSLTLPEGLTHLRSLQVWGNNLTNLTLPEGLSSLYYVGVEGNPINAVVVPLWMNLDYLDIAGFPKESVTFHAGSVKMQDGQLHWPHGVLEYAPDLDSEWITIPTSSPFPFSPIGERGFFRVRVDE